jgi:hypothetical protein
VNPQNRQRLPLAFNAGFPQERADQLAAITSA